MTAPPPKPCTTSGKAAFFFGSFGIKIFDYPEVAENSDVLACFKGPSGDAVGTVSFPDALVVFSQTVEHRHRCPTGNGIAGIGVRMQKGVIYFFIIKRVINFFAGQRDRQGQCSAGKPFG